MAGLLTLLTLLLVAPFVLAIDPSLARAPACTEYCYEPIPVPGADSGAPGSSSGGRGETGPAGPESGLAEQGTISKAEKALGVVAVAQSRDGQAGADRPGGSQSLGLGGTSKESEKGASGTWMALLIVLGAGTLALFLVGFRRVRGEGMARADVLVRVAALAVGMGLIYLLSPGISGASAASAPRSFFGMMSLEEISQQDAQRMARGGVSSFRLPVNWSLVQSGPEAGFNWDLVDPSIETLARSGVRILPFLYGTPSGLAARPTSLPIRTTAQKEGWAAFLRATIRRYGPSGDFWRENPDVPKLPLRTWQIWNEANFFYFTTPVIPADYVKLLKASFKVVKRADPGAKVMLSGLYGSPPNQPKRAMKSWQFLDKLYDLGAKGSFDSIAIHPYTRDTEQLELLLETVRKTLNKNGARGTPIDITEIGWGSDRKTAFGKGTTQAQAQQLTSGFDYLLANRRKLGIRSAYWFAWKDISSSVETCNFCYSTGLFYSGSGLRPKPAWDAFVRITGGKRN